VLSINLLYDWHRRCFARLREINMVDAIFNQQGYAGAKKMLDATVLRHTAIAQNLANLETPQYRRVDLNPGFQEEFAKALKSEGVADLARLEPTLTEDMNAVASTRDGNTVRLEDEMLRLSQNTLQHAFETQLVSSSLLKLRLAITGKS
jgi:flagellar basal-body rod protein FlgB